MVILIIFEFIICLNISANAFSSMDVKLNDNQLGFINRLLFHDISVDSATSNISQKSFSSSNINYLFVMVFHNLFSINLFINDIWFLYPLPLGFCCIDFSFRQKYVGQSILNIKWNDINFIKLRTYLVLSC